MRLLVFAALVFAAVWLLKRALERFGDDDRADPGHRVHGELVSCARCGLHLPRAEAREAAGELYCSDEHARLGRGAR